MMSDVAMLVKDDMEAMMAARKNGHHRAISEAYKQITDSRNYLFMRYGREGVAEYIRQRKAASHGEGGQVRAAGRQGAVAHC